MVVALPGRVDLCQPRSASGLAPAPAGWRAGASAPRDLAVFSSTIGWNYAVDRSTIARDVGWRR